MYGKEKAINIVPFIILIIIFIYLLCLNLEIDKSNDIKLNNIVCHKEVERTLPVISETERLVIESVISDYWKKRKMNKSNMSKIINSIENGAMRGALGGIILGGGIYGAATSGLVFGTMGGLLTSYNLTYGSTKYLNNIKHT